MTEVLLIQPPIRDFYMTAKRTLPYGLAAVAAALMREGVSVSILDGLATRKRRTLPFPPEMAFLKTHYGTPDRSPFALFGGFSHFGLSFEHLGRSARASGAVLVGISSLFTAYAGEAALAAEAVKRHHPDCRVVLGGHHPTVLPEAAMACDAVDYVLRGEGEVSLPALAASVREGRVPWEVPGIVHRKPEGGLRITPPAFMERLEDHPFPNLDLISRRFYRRKQGGSAVVVASRGCPMKCSYCALGEFPVPYRRRGVPAVLSEIEHAVVRHGAGFIDFEDENLSLDRRWFLDLLSGIAERFRPGPPELRAMNGLFPPTLDAPVVTAMKAAGFRALNLSLGTFHPGQLGRFNRPDVREGLLGALRLAAVHDLSAVTYIIAGAPGQYGADTVDDLLHLSALPTLSGVSVFYPAPGSADYRRCRDRRLLPGSFSLMRASALPISDTTTRLEAATLLRLGRILNFMKELAGRGLPIPRPAPVPVGSVLDPGDRRASGMALLGGFLHDGRIRGVTPGGEVFAHPVAPELTRRFLSGIEPDAVAAPRRPR